MNHTPIPTNFIYPDIKPEHYRLGATTQGVPLRPDGDWRDYVPSEELQNRRGIESAACYTEGQQHTIATVEEEKFGEIDNNYSARFNALLSGGTETGGDPLRAADSIRNDGLVPDTMMPFGEDIKSWSDFHSWKGVNPAIVKLAGQQYRGRKKLTNEIVFERHESVQDKYAKAKNALMYSPLPVSVVGWYEKDGIYFKPPGTNDNHLVELLHIDSSNNPYIFDTYPPFLKKLDANYNFDFGMRWSVEMRTQAEQLSALQRILQGLLMWLRITKLGAILGL